MITVERQSLLNAELCASSSIAPFFQALRNVQVSFGFKHVTIARMPGPDDQLFLPLACETTLAEHHLREFDRRRFLTKCAIIPLLRKSVLPRAWDLRNPDDIMATDAERVEIMIRFGLPMGVIFPQTSIDGSRFMIRFDGNRSPLEQAELNELAMIVAQAFEVYDTIRRRNTSAPNILSARELEVVRWTAQGKTSVEIGRILSLSDHTVNAYLTNAIKKLDCVNRTQLVAKALRLKLIS